MTDLSGSRVLITGAASGIGRLLAEKMAARGASLILWDIDEATLDETRALFLARGFVASAYVCDLSQKHAIKETAKRVIDDHGGVDILVNNAGVVSGRALAELSDEQIELTFAVNTLALFWTTRAFLPGMRERGHGHLVTIASAAGLVGTAQLTDYCASKFAAVGFDEALRIELNRDAANIQTTIVCPFYISTGMFHGVKTRFDLLMPILTPEYATTRIVRSVERNRRRLIMPRMVYTSWLARLLPLSWFDALMGFFGVNASMDDFVGEKSR